MTKKQFILKYVQGIYAAYLSSLKINYITLALSLNLDSIINIHENMFWLICIKSTHSDIFFPL